MCPKCCSNRYAIDPNLKKYIYCIDCQNYFYVEDKVENEELRLYYNTFRDY